MTGYIDLLGPEALRQHGVPAPWHLGRADRVRFHELDALNHVNNTSYLTWFETFRVDYSIRYGLAYDSAEAPVLVLKSSSIDYLRPMLLHEDYIVTGRTTRFRTTSFVMDYAVFTNGVMAATGNAIHVLFEPDGVTRRAIPEAVRAQMIRDDGAVADS